MNELKTDTLGEVPETLLIPLAARIIAARVMEMGESARAGTRAQAAE